MTALETLRTGFQRDVLRAVAVNEPTKGSRVKETLLADYEDITHGRLYPTLDALVDRGFVNKQTREPDNRSNQYEVTDKGRNALSELTAGYEEVAAHV